MKKRSKLQIYYEIIAAANKLGSPARIRKVLKIVNIHFKRGDEILEEMESKGLIKLGYPCFDQVMILMMEAHRFCEYYRELKGMLNEKV